MEPIRTGHWPGLAVNAMHRSGVSLPVCLSRRMDIYLNSPAGITDAACVRRGSSTSRADTGLVQTCSTKSLYMYVLAQY